MFLRKREESREIILTAYSYVNLSFGSNPLSPLKYLVNQVIVQSFMWEDPCDNE